MSHRDLKFLNDNRIIYRRYSSDMPTSSHKWGWYYKKGTNGYYTMFNNKAKINTIRSLKWHLLTLWYLNPDMNKDKFILLAEYICYKQNGFITFSAGTKLINKLIEDVYKKDLDSPPKNKLRKIVFKDFCGLNKKEKLKIVGGLIGKKTMIDKEVIYQCMIDLNDDGKKITISKIANILNCSSRTIYRNMCNELNEEKKLLNEKV
jgi:hypothetical protein|tara:strand:- start:535 stop:1149 length:615 start_codon:yes stop_codon:yes gene_type:complete